MTNKVVSDKEYELIERIRNLVSVDDLIAAKIEEVIYKSLSGEDINGDYDKEAAVTYIIGQALGEIANKVIAERLQSADFSIEYVKKVTDRYIERQIAYIVQSTCCIEARKISDESIKKMIRKTMAKQWPEIPNLKDELTTLVNDFCAESVAENNKYMMGKILELERKLLEFMGKITC